MPDAKAGHRAYPLTPSGGTTPRALMTDLPTTRTPVRVVDPNLDRTLPVDSTGNADRHWYGGGTEHLDEKSSTPWSVQRYSC